MRRLFRIVAIAVMVLTLPALLAAKDARYDLRYHLKKGGHFRVNYERWQRNDRTIMGNRLVDESTLRTEERFKVTRSGRSGMELEITYGERSLEIDRADLPVGPDFSALKGEQARFLLAPDVARSEFEGFEELPEIRMPAMGDVLEAERYKLELFGYFPHLPGRPVSAGESWTYSEAYQDPNSGSPLDVEIDYSYTCTGPVPGEPGRLIGIDCSYKVKVYGDVDAGGLMLSLHMEGGGEERYRFDTKRGMLVSSEGTMWVEGKAVNAELEMEAPIRNDYRISLELTF